MEYIEDCLETVAGLQKNDHCKIELEKSDCSIMFSIARQTFKGIALSDRQFMLMQDKLLKYTDQFKNQNIDVEHIVTQLRNPLRAIDRSKYIKVISFDELNEKINKLHLHRDISHLPWVEIRFPFSKKMIMKLEKFRKANTNYVHETGSHIHFFALTEENAFQCIEQFGNSNFDIDPIIVEMHKEISSWNKADHVPGVYNYKIKNLPEDVVTNIVEEIGEPNERNLYKYYDRRNLYGLAEIDVDFNEGFCSNLTSNIAKRPYTYFYIDSNEYPLEHVFRTLDELDRYPINILLDDENAFDTLTQTYQIVCNYIPNNQITVLYRKDTHTDADGYNMFVKQKGLNSPVDKDTKIVYTLKNKVNKPLLNSDCNPIVALSFDTERYMTTTNSYLQEFDIVIDYADKAPMWRDWRSRT